MSDLCGSYLDIVEVAHNADGTVLCGHDMGYWCHLPKDHRGAHANAFTNVSTNRVNDDGEQVAFNQQVCVTWWDEAESRTIDFGDGT